MNPLTGALKYLSSGLFKTILALVFFVIAAHYTTPAFVGKVAIIQLLEVVTLSALVLLPTQLITRDIADDTGAGRPDTELVGTILSLSIMSAPAFLFLLFFPSYVWLSSFYLFLYLYTIYQAAILSGRGKFTETNVGSVINSISRWGISIIAVVYHSIYLFILIWTLGVLVKAIYQQLAMGKSSFTFSRRKFLDTFRTGLPLYFSSISGFFAGQGDRLSTAFLLGSYYLGIYQLMVLIAGVPATMVSSLTQAILPASTYYKARGHSLQSMSSITFRLMMMISVIGLIISMPIAIPLITRFFPQYIPGIPSFELLLFALLLATPFGALVNFIVVLRRGFKPLLALSVLDAALVVLTSLILIPRIGIFGAAISQAIVQATYAAFITALAHREGAFRIGRLELLTIISTLALILMPFAWEASLVIYLILVRLLGTFTKNDLSVISQFLPDRLRFIERILKPLAK